MKWYTVRTESGWIIALSSLNISKTDIIMFSGTEDECWRYAFSFKTKDMCKYPNQKSDNLPQPNCSFNHIKISKV